MPKEEELFYDTLSSPRLETDEVVLLIEDKKKDDVDAGVGVDATSPLASPKTEFADFNSSSISLLKTILGAGIT